MYDTTISQITQLTFKNRQLLYVIGGCKQQFFVKRIAVPSLSQTEGNLKTWSGGGEEEGVRDASDNSSRGKSE